MSLRERIILKAFYARLSSLSSNFISTRCGQFSTRACPKNSQGKHTDAEAPRSSPSRIILSKRMRLA